MLEPRNSDGGTVWWNSGRVMLEQCGGKCGETVMVEECGGRVCWNSETVLVEQ